MDTVEKIGQQAGNVDFVNTTQGTYRGQAVVNPLTNAPSLIQLSAEISGYRATSQKQRKKILDRKIVSKKTFQEKQNILATYTERLGQERESKKYKDTYQDLQRLQYKEEFNSDPQKLCDTILYDIAGVFGEVTEQDNFLECALATNNIDQQRIQEEIDQVTKMIDFLNHPDANRMNVGFANSERLRWEEKLADLQNNLATNQLLREQLTQAQTTLRSLHKQEIRDGYNLIPKALSVLDKYGADSGTSAISLAISYRDEILVMKNPLDVFEVFLKRQQKKRESFRPYIDSMIALFGCDISSANPSRSKEELHGVRDSLFRVEICGQTYDSIGAIGNNIRRMFLNSDEHITDKEQLSATQELVRLTQSAFVSSQQITHLIDLFSTEAKNLQIAIYTLNQIIDLVRDLPEKFFQDDQAQGKFIISAQKTLDNYILKEEELAGQAYLNGE